MYCGQTIQQACCLAHTVWVNSANNVKLNLNVAPVDVDINSCQQRETFSSITFLLKLIMNVVL